MRFPVRANLVLLTSFLLVSCNHSDVTGPGDVDYVHVRVVNGSSVSIVVPAMLSIGQFLSQAELPPGASAEIPLSSPYLYGSSFGLARSVLDPHLSAIIYFTFVRPPAGGRILAYANVRVVAEPGTPVSATTDRPDLLSITRIEQF